MDVRLQADVAHPLVKDAASLIDIVDTVAIAVEDEWIVTPIKKYNRSEMLRASLGGRRGNRLNPLGHGLVATGVGHVVVLGGGARRDFGCVDCSYRTRGTGLNAAMEVPKNNSDSAKKSTSRT